MQRTVVLLDFGNKRRMSQQARCLYVVIKVFKVFKVDRCPSGRVQVAPKTKLDK